MSLLLSRTGGGGGSGVTVAAGPRALLRSAIVFGLAAGGALVGAGRRGVAVEVPRTGTATVGVTVAAGPRGIYVAAVRTSSTTGGATVSAGPRALYVSPSRIGVAQGGAQTASVGGPARAVTPPRQTSATGGATVTGRLASLVSPPRSSAASGAAVVASAQSARVVSPAQFGQAAEIPLAGVTVAAGPPAVLASVSKTSATVSLPPAADIDLERQGGAGKHIYSSTWPRPRQDVTVEAGPPAVMVALVGRSEAPSRPPDDEEALLVAIAFRMLFRQG